MFGINDLAHVLEEFYFFGGYAQRSRCVAPLSPLRGRWARSHRPRRGLSHYVALRWRRLRHNYYIFTKVVFNEQLLKMRTKDEYVISRINVKHELPFYVAFDCLRYVVLF